MSRYPKKRVENYEQALAIHCVYYNSCRIHQTLRVTPAMEADISDHVWSLDEVTLLVMDICAFT